MKATCQRMVMVGIGVLVGLAMCGEALAQSLVTTSTDSAPSGASAIPSYRQQREALISSWETLCSQGATSQQVASWMQQSAPVIIALQQEAQNLGATSALQPMPVLQHFSSPANASPALLQFLTTRANLINARAQVHNQLLQSISSRASPAQVAALYRQEEQTFRQQYGASLRMQVQQSQSFAAEMADQPIPSTAVFSSSSFSDAPPALRAYLAARNALLVARTQLWNQNITDTPAARTAAIQQWEQQHAAVIAQVRTLAQKLANTTAIQPNLNR